MIEAVAVISRNGDGHLVFADGQRVCYVKLVDAVKPVRTAGGTEGEKFAVYADAVQQVARSR